MTQEDRIRLQQRIESDGSSSYSHFEYFIFGVILVNAVVIYLQVSGYSGLWLSVLDFLCTLIFIFEMVIKQVAWGVKGYWKSGWNKMDGILVILSFPSLLTPFVEVAGGSLSVLLALRLLRVLKFFRVMKFFPNFTTIMSACRKAMHETWAVIAAFVVVILIFALINCSLFGHAAPEYFGKPLTAFYSVFRLFTIEGWYDIPDAVSAGLNGASVGLIRLYFSFLLIVGGILGMSLINSIFVDAMAEDNNDVLLKRLDEMDEENRKLREQNAAMSDKLDRILEQLNK